MNEAVDSQKRQALQQDEALARAFQAGEESAFDKLVLRHKDKVFSLCYRFLGDYNEADDSAQEAFIKVYRSLKRFRFESSLSTWLYRITVNTCKNKLASSQYRKGRAMVRLDEPRDPEKGGHPLEIKDESLSPAVELEKREKEMFIQSAIDSLPNEQKTVVVLREVEGLSYEEITAITGYAPGTVKSKLARARQALREKLKGKI
jgi:RNA polymerase sigma-70 factor (ECF subfamily)